MYWQRRPPAYTTKCGHSECVPLLLGWKGKQYQWILHHRDGGYLRAEPTAATLMEGSQSNYISHVIIKANPLAVALAYRVENGWHGDGTMMQAILERELDAAHFNYLMSSFDGWLQVGCVVWPRSQLAKEFMALVDREFRRGGGIRMSESRWVAKCVEKMQTVESDAWRYYIWTEWKTDIRELKKQKTSEALEKESSSPVEELPAYTEKAGGSTRSLGRG